MANQFRQLAWNFDVPNVNNLLAPIQQGFRDVRQAEQQYVENQRADRGMAIQEGQFGLQKQRHEEEKQKAVRERAGNLALLTLQEPDEGRRTQRWQQFMFTHPNAAGLDPKYHDPRTGPLAVLADAGMAPQYLDYQIRQAAERRAGAAEGRAAAMHGPQLSLANTQATAAQRDLDAPKSTLNIVPEGGTLVATNPRTGTHQVVATGGPKPMKEHETKDAMWAERLLRSEGSMDTIAGIDGQGTPTQGAYNPARSANRFAPDSPGIWNLYTANLFNSTNWQRYQQAAREGIAALLRKDTGAAVTQQEWDLYFPTYYPQPGDSPAVVLQKKQAREAASQALRTASGGAFDRMFPNYSLPGQPNGRLPQGQQGGLNQNGVKSTINGKNYELRNGQWFEE